MFKTFKNGSLLALLLLSQPSLAEEIPPLPPSMIEKLTVPLGEIKVKPLYFQRNSNILGKEDKEYIENISEKLSDMPVYVVIEAHTDHVGDENRNRQLSLKRAESVKSTMQNKLGWANHRFFVIGYGEEFASNWANPADRRVEIRLLLRKQESAKIENYRQEMRAKGIDLKAYNADPSEMNAATKRSNNTLEKVSAYASGWNFIFGLVTGAGLNDTDAKLSYSGIRIEGTWNIPSSYMWFLSLEFQNLSKTYKFGNPSSNHFSSTGLPILNAGYVSRLHKIMFLRNKLGVFQQTNQIRKISGSLEETDSLALKRNEVLKKEEIGVQYVVGLEFDIPKYDFYPGVSFQALATSSEKSFGLLLSIMY